MSSCSQPWCKLPGSAVSSGVRYQACSETWSALSTQHLQALSMRTRLTPRSPTGRTSGRPKAKIWCMWQVQTPIPLTFKRASTSSSSDMLRGTGPGEAALTRAVCEVGGKVSRASDLAWPCHSHHRGLTPIWRRPTARPTRNGWRGRAGTTACEPRGRKPSRCRQAAAGRCSGSARGRMRRRRAGRLSSRPSC